MWAAKRRHNSTYNIQRVQHSLWNWAFQSTKQKSRFSGQVLEEGPRQRQKALAVAMAAATGLEKVSRCRSVWKVCDAVPCCLCLPPRNEDRDKSVFHLPQSVRSKITWWNSGGANLMSRLPWVFKLVGSREERLPGFTCRVIDLIVKLIWSVGAWLAQSVKCDSWSHSHEFQPHDGRGAYLKTEQNENLIWPPYTITWKH